MNTPGGKEALFRAVDLAGGQTALASKIKVSQARVWNWLYRDVRLPAEYAIPIEDAVAKQITREQLRPDLYPQETAA